jgi:hypothetical protein
VHAFIQAELVNHFSIGSNWFEERANDNQACICAAVNRSEGSDKISKSLVSANVPEEQHNSSPIV